MSEGYICLVLTGMLVVHIGLILLVAGKIIEGIMNLKKPVKKDPLT